jgi:hypothetical protein
MLFDRMSCLNNKSTQSGSYYFGIVVAKIGKRGSRIKSVSLGEICTYQMIELAFTLQGLGDSNHVPPEVSCFLVMVRKDIQNLFSNSPQADLHS